MSIKEIELAMYEFVQGHNFSEPQKKAVIDFVFAQLEKFGASQAQQTTAELPEPAATVYRHPDGRRRVLFPDSVTDCDASWQPTERLHTSTQMHDHFAAGVRAGAAQQQAIQRGIDKVLAAPVKHGLDLGDKQ